jgi:hypothetical protein
MISFWLNFRDLFNVEPVLRISAFTTDFFHSDIILRFFSSISPLLQTAFLLTFRYSGEHVHENVNDGSDFFIWRIVQVALGFVRELRCLPLLRKLPNLLIRILIARRDHCALLFCPLILSHRLCVSRTRTVVQLSLSRWPLNCFGTDSSFIRTGRRVVP